MHPNGEIPAYEFDFSDTTPPLHAWACWRIYKITGEKGQRDLVFLARVFQKLLLKFTWWVNRKDIEGKNLFSVVGWIAGRAGLEIIPSLIVPLAALMVVLHRWLVQHAPDIISGDT